MKLLSKVNISGFDYYVALNDTKGSQDWYLVSVIHPKNYSKVGKDQLVDSLSTADLYTNSYGEYVVEGVRRSKKTGKVQTLRTSRVVNTLDKIISSYIDARDLAYPKENIIATSSDVDLENKESFSAMYKDYLISYEKIDGIYYSLTFSANGFDLKFSQNSKLRFPKNLEFVGSTSSSKTSIAVASLPTIDVKSLSNIVDLSWYMDLETGVKKKNYTSASTIAEFESRCVTPMIRRMKEEIKQGIRPRIGSDTETDGLELYDLSIDNPNRCSISTIQFSWEDDQGIIIYLDMEFMDNVNKEYVMNRFKQLFDYSVRTPDSLIDLYYEEDGTKLTTPERHHFKRKDYDLVGHHTIFDSRVTLSEGTQYFFDHDTLQMAFNIDPTVTRGSKKLKRLTRYFFGHETPELVDLLGKGNEDKFRYLKDEEITRIYGCADSDYTRKLFPVLRKLMTDLMFKSYCSIDPITWYVSAQSEFHGMKLEEELLSKNSEIIQKDIERVKDIIYTYVGFTLKKRSELALSSKDLKLLTTPDSLEDQEGDEDFLNSESVSKHKFKLKGAAVRKVMYNLLKYPVLVKTDSGLGAVNTDAFTKLLYYKNENTVKLMSKDVVSNDGETVLIESKKFNSYKYPLCYLLKVYAGIDKEYTTYYKGFEREDLEGRLFKSISTTNIETRRMSSAAQQIKKSMKAMIKPHNLDWYQADWDFDQVEARIFISDAHDEKGIIKFTDHEKDYHTENAGLMFGLPPHLVSKALRSYAKAIGFGIPYGLSDYKLCERLFTIHSKSNDQKTIDLRMKFEFVNRICMDYLNSIRDKALEVVDVPVELKRFWSLADDAKVSMIKNKHGFYRYFPLDDVIGDKRKEQSKRRQAGNFTIQSFAADMFKFAIKRFYNRLIKEGIDDKVIFNMYIHDELLFSVHKSVDPRFIAKLCAEECMFRLKGHTNYFIGLGFGNSWLECKDDKNELPSGLLSRISKDFDSYELNEWTDDAAAFMKPKLEQYHLDRISEYLKELQPSVGSSPFDVSLLESKFTNYKVRGYVYAYKDSYVPHTHLNSDNEYVDDDDDKLLSCLCNVIKFLDIPDMTLLIDGVVVNPEDYVATRKLTEVPKTENESVESDLFFDDDFEEEDNFWSLDDEENVEEHLYNMYEYDVEEISFELPKRTYKYVKNAGHNVVLTCARPKNVKSVEELVKKYKSASGKKVVIETLTGAVALTGKYDINFDTLNEFLKGVN